MNLVVSRGAEALTVKLQKRNRLTDLFNLGDPGATGTDLRPDF